MKALVNACLEIHTADCLVDAFTSRKTPAKVKEAFRALFEGSEGAIEITPTIQYDLEVLSTGLCVCKMAPHLPTAFIGGKRS